MLGITARSWRCGPTAAWGAACLAAICVATLLAGARSQAEVHGQDEAARPAQAGRIAPGELLIISMEGLMLPGEETRLTRRVGEEGELWLPVLDEQPVIARDLTPGQLQMEIKRAYQRRSVRMEVVAVARPEMGEDQQLVVPREAERAGVRR